MYLGEVELSDEDEAQIEMLSDREFFTQKDAEAIVRYAVLPRHERDPTHITSYVTNGQTDEDDVFDGITEPDCADIRRRMADASRPKSVVEDFPGKHPSVIFRHATGRCGHDIAEDPTTSPRIKPEECKDMRVAFQNGDTVGDICDDFHRSTNAVNRHVFGRCDHVFDDDDHRHSKTDEPTCAAMRSAYRQNESATVAGIARAFLTSSGTAHRHLRGNCNHDPDVDPIQSTFDGYVDSDECADMRRAYFEGIPCKRLASEGGITRDYQIIRKHVFGRCGHEHDVEAAETSGTDVGKQDCANMRRAYKSETGATVEDLRRRFDVGKGTLYYHVFGNCTHDDKREEPAQNHRE